MRAGVILFDVGDIASYSEVVGGHLWCLAALSRAKQRVVGMTNMTCIKYDDLMAAPGRNGLTGAALGVGLLAGCCTAPGQASAEVILSNLGASASAYP